MPQVVLSRGKRLASRRKKAKQYASSSPSATTQGPGSAAVHAGCIVLPGTLARLPDECQVTSDTKGLTWVSLGLAELTLDGVMERQC